MSDADRDGSAEQGGSGGWKRSGDHGGRPGELTPAVAFAGVVFVASVVPIRGLTERVSSEAAGNGTAMPFEGIGLTDPFHLVSYAVLAVLVSRATGRHLVGLLVAAAVATSFGFGIELVQAPIPWRGFAWGDVLVNAVGAGLGVVGVRVVGAVRE